jgi:RNA polymerase-binding transcription factor DksA
VKILPQQVPNDAPPAASIASGLPAAYPPQPQPQLQPQSPAPAQKGAKRRLCADATPLGADATISAEDGAAGLGGRTTTFLVDTIVGLKEDMRAMADQMCRMQKKMRKNAKQCKEHHHRHHRSDHHHHHDQDGQSTHQVLRQLQRRVAQLEEDNSQLRNQLAHIAASRYGICASPAATTTALAATTFTSADTSSSSASSSPSSSPPGSWAMGDSFQGMRVVGGDGAGAGAGARYADAPAEVETGLGREMLWCFPFLRHFDFSSRRFVVDDLQYVVLFSSIVFVSLSTMLYISIYMTRVQKGGCGVEGAPARPDQPWLQQRRIREPSVLPRFRLLHGTRNQYQRNEDQLLLMCRVCRVCRVCCVCRVPCVRDRPSCSVGSWCGSCRGTTRTDSSMRGLTGTRIVAGHGMGGREREREREELTDEPRSARGRV